jgi:hypothetical protein
MALSPEEVEGYLIVPKAVPDGRTLSWRKRSDSVQMARVPVEVGAVEMGELLLVIKLAQRRHWSFALLLHSAEVMRWDFLSAGPRRHRNPPGRPNGWPAIDRSLEHEHVWHAGLGTDCSRPLQGGSPHDHREAYARFCDAANVDPKDSYREPPPPSPQQMKLT